MDERCLLISMPSLQDPYFFRTTTLLTEFNEKGAMGIVLNRPIQLSLSEVLGEKFEGKAVPPIRIYWGGPVQGDRGWIVHEDASLESESIIVEPGLFISNSVQALLRLIEANESKSELRFRFFLGYAGWGAGQLQSEMAAASWITSPFDRNFLFDASPETLWERSIQKIGIDPMSIATPPTSQIH